MPNYFKIGHTKYKIHYVKESCGGTLLHGPYFSCTTQSEWGNQSFSSLGTSHEFMYPYILLEK